MISRWPLALDLEERLQSLRKSGVRVPLSPLGEKRLKKWTESDVFRGNDLFPRFLASLGATEEEFSQLLSQENSSIAAGAGEENWLHSLPAAGGKPPPAAYGLVEGLQKFNVLLFWAYRAILQRKAETLAAEYPGIFVPAEILPSLTEFGLFRLRRLCQRSLVLEVNIARLEERLAGETPEERFQDFVRQLEDPEVCWKIFDEYPVLLRDCARTLQQWVESSCEFLERLCRDRDLLADFFRADKLRLVKISGGLGDAHRNGKSVLMAEFSNGEKIVYKPRSLAADAAFQEFVQELNAWGLSPAQPVFRVLDRGEYGWTEFVPYLTCKSEEELNRFYLRQGAWLAIFYALGTTDMHMENVIANGENPVPIDLETIFHPRLFLKEPLNADDVAAERFLDSVLAIGLLPSPIRGAGRTIDKSGLGATSHQESPVEVDGLVGLGTDQIHIGKVHGRLGEIYSQPSLNGERPNAHFYRSFVQAGFDSAYRLLLQKKAELLSEDGNLSRFAEVPVRVVVRPSADYASFLGESSHPRLLRNTLQREIFFAQLWSNVLLIPAYERLCPSERKQLLCGDIPYFLSRPNSCDLGGGDGSFLPGALALSGLDAAKNRIARMSEADLGWQSWLIDAAFGSSDIQGSFPRREPPSRKISDLVDAAVYVGEQLHRTAVRRAGTASWVCLVYDSGGSQEEEGSYRVGIVDDSLYRGLSGIVLFLAQLAKQSGREEFRTLAEEGLATLEARSEQWKANQCAGVHLGLGAKVFLYARLGQLWSRQDLFDKAVELLELLPALIEADTTLDIIAGCGGLIPVLLELARERPGSNAKALALRCGERITEQAVIRVFPGGQGIGWEQFTMPRGFSHGASGMAWVLGLLAAAGLGGHFERAALAALAYERHLLKGDHWTDIPDKTQTSCFWCHGAAGIGLARLELSRLITDPLLELDARSALERLCQAPPRTSSILCHGDLGNLDTLELATRVFPEGKWSGEYNAAKKAILEDFQHWSWATPLPSHLAEPGMMMGLAGVGYGLLRLASPEEVPSLLTLSGSACLK
jgi:type 2 lantibiotic biosynthesis protein LanM